MTRPAVLPVEELSIPSQNFAHDRGDAMLAALEEDMDAIFHQYSRTDGALSLCDPVAQTLKEACPIFLVEENRGPVDPSHHDVVQGTGRI